MDHILVLAVRVRESVQKEGNSPNTVALLDALEASIRGQMTSKVFVREHTKPVQEEK